MENTTPTSSSGHAQQPGEQAEEANYSRLGGIGVNREQQDLFYGGYIPDSRSPQTTQLFSGFHPLNYNIPAPEPRLPPSELSQEPLESVIYINQKFREYFEIPLYKNIENALCIFSPVQLDVMKEAIDNIGTSEHIETTCVVDESNYGNQQLWPGLKGYAIQTLGASIKLASFDQQLEFAGKLRQLVAYLISPPEHGDFVDHKDYTQFRQISNENLSTGLSSYSSWLPTFFESIVTDTYQENPYFNIIIENLDEDKMVNSIQHSVVHDGNISELTKISVLSSRNNSNESIYNNVHPILLKISHTIEHTKSQNIGAVLDIAKHFYNAALTADNQEDCIAQTALFAYYFAHATPFMRGSASVNEILISAILTTQGFTGVYFTDAIDKFAYAHPVEKGVEEISKIFAYNSN